MFVLDLTQSTTNPDARNNSTKFFHLFINIDKLLCKIRDLLCENVSLIKGMNGERQCIDGHKSNR